MRGWYFLSDASVMFQGRKVCRVDVVSLTRYGRYNCETGDGGGETEQ